MVDMTLVDLSLPLILFPSLFLSLKPRSHIVHLSNNCHDFDQSSILMSNTKTSGLFSRVYILPKMNK